MTISTAVNRIAYTGDGASVAFTFPYLFLANADIAVYVDGVEATTGFTTTGAGTGSGTVTFTTAPANLAAIVLVRDPDFLQNTALTSNGPFPSDSVERMADKAMIGVQRVSDLVGRALVLADGDAAATLPLPLLATRASKYLGFDASGLPIALAAPAGTTLVSAFAATLLDDTTAAAARATLGAFAIGNLQHVQGFRLTLTTALPVTTADVTGAGTIFACPYKGNQISLYSSGAWGLYTSAQFSLALSALTSGRPYDVFCYANAGVPTLEFLAWTSDTARATALAYQDGVLVKSGDSTRRYLGTFYTTGVATTEDSVTNRYLSNYYHRVPRKMVKAGSSASWTYTVAAWRQAAGSTANQVNFVVGVAEDAVHSAVHTNASSSGVTVRGVSIGVGLNSTTTPADSLSVFAQCSNVAAVPIAVSLPLLPAAGKNFAAWLEFAAGTDTQTFGGTGNGGHLTATVMG